MKKTLVLLTLSVALAVPSLALAQEEMAGPNTGAIRLSAGFDITTQYNFRGMNIEDQGFIIQPWVEINSNLYEGDALAPVLEGVGLKFGTWNSMQDASPGTFGHPQWFELDLYVGVVLDLPYDLTGEVTYIYRKDPEGAALVAPGDIWAEEVDLTLAYDDSGLWNLDIPGFEGLQPHVLVAIETDGAADGTGNGGDTYYEIGIEPSVCIVQSEDWPVTLSVPMTLGFGSDYYEYRDPTTGALKDDSFGYFDIGLVASVPLNFVPAAHGQWEAHAGVHVMFLGDGAEALTTNSDLDDTEIIGSFGVSMSY